MPVARPVLTDEAPLNLPDEAFESAVRREKLRAEDRVELTLLVPRYTAERLEDLAALLCEEDRSRTVDAIATDALEAFLKAKGA